MGMGETRSWTATHTPRLDDVHISPVGATGEGGARMFPAVPNFARGRGGCVDGRTQKIGRAKYVPSGSTVTALTFRLKGSLGIGAFSGSFSCSFVVVIRYE